MRSIRNGDSTFASVLDAISNGTACDYVYMYPPRQAYGALPSSIDNKILSSFLRTSRLNLYVHIPFCRQICSFCNLYTSANRSRLHRPYLNQLLAELQFYATNLVHTQIATLYIGGGTPSLFDPALVAELVDYTSRLGTGFGPGCEIALEVAPETVDSSKLEDFRRAGINRINLGYQSFVPNEVNLLGRRRGSSSVNQILEKAVTIGFSNVCVDLIYGLEGQTQASWVDSLTQVILFRPQTVCCYPLTLRPLTGYAKRGYGGVFRKEQNSRYITANQLLCEAGYGQETHVRWILPGGGYKQKEYHWAMDNVLGVGVGARSYLWEIDLRNSYSVLNRNTLLQDYLLHDFSKGTRFNSDGYIMSDDERRRKFVILGLANLDRKRYRNFFSSNPESDFPDFFTALARLGLIDVASDRFSLTPAGMLHRDVIVQHLFSDNVVERLNGFQYAQ